MKAVLILIALAAGIVAGIASAGISRAGVPTAPMAAAPETASVQAVRAVITRCLPSVGQSGKLVTAGLRRLPDVEERAILGARQGQVWMRDDHLMLVDFRDIPACLVIALSVDPAVLADLVMRVFAEADGTFRRERFRLDEDGGFAAVYTTEGPAGGMVIRISTSRQANGTHFASLNVARAAPAVN